MSTEKDHTEVDQTEPIESETYGGGTLRIEVEEQNEERLHEAYALSKNGRADSIDGYEIFAFNPAETPYTIEVESGDAIEEVEAAGIYDPGASAPVSIEFAVPDEVDPVDALEAAFIEVANQLE